MHKALSPEPLLHSHSCDLEQKAFEVGEEGEVCLPGELADAPVVELVGDLQWEAYFALVIVETEE